jgi:small-conductance mechanosensitive channel
MFDTYFLENSPQAWLTAAGVAVFIFLILKIFQNFLVRRLERFTRKTETLLDDALLEVVRQTKRFFLAAVALYAGSFVLVLSPGNEQSINTAVVIVAILQGALWGNSAISFWLGNIVQRRKVEDGATATSLTALIFVGKLILWSVAALLVLENLGVNITALVAGLGIGGIAVALALQNVLGDLFASLSIVLDKPFVIGDFIIVDQHLGTVEHIGLKTTRIRSLSGEQVIFSNADLLRSRIRNFKRMYERRIVFSIGVTYDTPYEKLAKIGSILREIVESKSDTRFDRAHFKEYSDSSLMFEVVYFVLKPDFNTYMDIQQSINLDIYRRFQELGIRFAFPTRTIHVENAKSDLQLARSRRTKTQRRTRP